MGIQNYADTAIQFGFSTLFVTALPCASFFSLISNYVKTKFNLWKLSDVSEAFTHLLYGVRAVNVLLFK